jgi:hypothetical protein
LRTVCPPGFLLILHYNLSEPCGESMMVIVHNSLANVQSGLADQVLEFLPAAAGWDLRS